MKFADKFVALLQKQLPYLVVEDSQGPIIAALPGTTAQLIGWLPSGDHRKAPTQQQVEQWLKSAASALRRDIPHYTPASAMDAQILLGRLSAENPDRRNRPSYSVPESLEHL